MLLASEAREGTDRHGGGSLGGSRTSPICRAPTASGAPWRSRTRPTAARRTRDHQGSRASSGRHQQPSGRHQQPSRTISNHQGAIRASSGRHQQPSGRHQQPSRTISNHQGAISSHQGAISSHQGKATIRAKPPSSQRSMGGRRGRSCLRCERVVAVGERDEQASEAHALMHTEDLDLPYKGGGRRWEEAGGGGRRREEAGGGP
jgi:hypothetical protein